MDENHLCVNRLTSCVWWLQPVILVTWEEEIRNIVVQGQPHLNQILGIVAGACHCSYLGKHK
jgi:hypothetical protein